MQLALRGLGASSVDTRFNDLVANQTFLDNCCYGLTAGRRYFYGGWFTKGCPEWIAANKEKFGGFEPCAFADKVNLTPAEIAANETNAGGHLSPESRAEATRQAQEAIAADIANHPELYSELCPSGQIPQADGTCAPCPDGFYPSGGVCVQGLNLGLGGLLPGIPTSVLVVGGVIAAALLLFALKR